MKMVKYTQGMSEPRHDMIQKCEDFRGLLNTESRSANGVAIDTSRLISRELSEQVTGKLDELKRDLNTQNTESTKLFMKLYFHLCKVHFLVKIAGLGQMWTLSLVD